MKKQFPQSKIPSHGFTLIEVLISLTILAFLMLLITKVTNNSVDHKGAIIEEDRELLQVTTALDRLSWDFSQIYTPLFHTQEFKTDPFNTEASLLKEGLLKSNPLYEDPGLFSKPDFFGRPIPSIKEEKDKAIEFYTKSNRRRFENSNESEFAWVRYEFRPYSGEDPSKEGLLELVRYYTSLDIYKEGLELKELQPTILCNKISEYKFFFWDEKTKKWEEHINRVSNEEHLLRGLKLKIKWKRGPDQIEESSSRIYRSIWPVFKPEDLNKIKYEHYQQNFPQSNQNDPKLPSDDDETDDENRDNREP